MNKPYNGIAKKPWNGEDSDIRRRRRAAELKGLTYRSGEKTDAHYFAQGQYDDGINKRKKKWRLGSHVLAKRNLLTPRPDKARP